MVWAVILFLLSVGLVIAVVLALRRPSHRAGPTLSVADQQGPDVLRERCMARIHRLEAKRQALEAVMDEAEDLKHRLAASEVHRNRVPLMDRSLRLLRQQAHLIDQLLGRYYRQHHDLELAAEAERFQRRLEGVTEGYGEELLDLREEIDHLDEEYQQLMLETEAQVEVENLLRRG